MKSYTYHKKVGGCGTLYCIFAEGDEGEFKRLWIKGAGKEHPCGESWIEPMAKILTFALRRSVFEGSVEKGILKQMRGVRCNTIAINKDRVVSCSDAISKMIEEYLKDRMPHLVSPTVKK